MKRTSFTWMTFLSALAIVSSLAFIVQAQAAGPSDQEMQDMARGMGMDPRQCDDLQNRINRIVAIYESSQSDNEKMASLSEAVAQSVAEMEQAASKDPEVATAGNQYIGLIQELLSAARTSASGDDKKVSDAVKDDLQKLKIMTKDYVQMMKLMCPGLTLPDVMTK
ncbi:MAG: hypothetical protein ACLP5H_17610 [Desulfomonilaceae bacterium]